MAAVRQARSAGTYSGSFHKGGPVRKTGVAVVHAGEYVLNKAQAAAYRRMKAKRK